MLRYIYADDLNRFPQLRDSMFRDRANQFKERLDWDVDVDANGHEIDEYDRLNPLYAIWQERDGSHGGSMRILPTVGDTMVNDHFLGLTGGVAITSPLIWEVTRFCISPSASNGVAAKLSLALAEIGCSCHLDHFVGVFDARMILIYRRLGWSPTVIGTSGEGRNAISVGLWEVSQATRDDLCARSGIHPATSAGWISAAFGPRELLAKSA
ncbi:MAG: acyl-homoserine-lactone synthase [Pseudomonadota bacterium]